MVIHAGGDIHACGQPSSELGYLGPGDGRGTRPEDTCGRYLSSRFGLFDPAGKILPRWSIQVLLLLLTSVVGLTWIRKRTIVVARRSLPETPNRTAQGLAIADAPKGEPINRAALAWEAKPPPEGFEGDGQKIGTALRQWRQPPRCDRIRSCWTYWPIAPGTHSSWPWTLRRPQRPPSSLRQQSE